MSQSKLTLALLLSIFLADRGNAQDTPDDNSGQPEVVSAQRGSFPIPFTKAGIVDSEEKIEFKSKSSGTLLDIVDSGTKVRSGLSSSQHEEHLIFQRDAVRHAESQVIEQKSRLASAEAARQEYVKGLYEIEKTSHRYAIEFAEQNLDLLKEEYDTAKKSVAPKLVLKRLTLQQNLASHNLDMAKRKLEVLEKYTFKKRNVELEAGIQLAKLALNQTAERLRIEKRKLKRCEANIQSSTNRVPEGIAGTALLGREKAGRTPGRRDP